MMAWGKDCSLWDDSVDVAQLEMFDFGQIPDDGSTMTTWHEDETIEDVFWFAQFCASHDNFELSLTYILHVSDLNRQDEFLMLFEAAKDA